MLTYEITRHHGVHNLPNYAKFQKTINLTRKEEKISISIQDFATTDLSHDHLFITATLFWPEQKLSQSFSYLKNPFNTATPLIRVWWPVSDRINGVPLSMNKA